MKADDYAIISNDYMRTDYGGHIFTSNTCSLDIILDEIKEGVLVLTRKNCVITYELDQPGEVFTIFIV